MPEPDPSPERKDFGKHFSKTGGIIFGVITQPESAWASSPLDLQTTTKIQRLYEASGVAVWGLLGDHWSEFFLAMGRMDLLKSKVFFVNDRYVANETKTGFSNRGLMCVQQASRVSPARTPASWR